MSVTYYGWDIGGAHLKVAQLNASGEIEAVRQLPSPLWQGVDRLASALDQLDFELRQPAAVHAVTMTGELCDVFPNRIVGVQQIVAAFNRYIGRDSRVSYYGGQRGWLRADELEADACRSVASANWLASGVLVATLIEHAWLIDVGSTTTDLLPLSAGTVQCIGADDASRLAASELVYTGVIRTPVMTICPALPFRGRLHPLAAEVFATMADVYRLLGLIDGDDDVMPTADGSGKDRIASARRLARMLGHDFIDSETNEFVALARALANEQRHSITRAMAMLQSRTSPHELPECLVGAGVGRFLVEQIAKQLGIGYVDFADLLKVPAQWRTEANRAVPAVAVAKLAWHNQ